jgi:hypothetical protein
MQSDCGVVLALTVQGPGNLARDKQLTTYLNAVPCSDPLEPHVLTAAVLQEAHAFVGSP